MPSKLVVIQTNVRAACPQFPDKFSNFVCLSISAVLSCIVLSSSVYCILRDIFAAMLSEKIRSTDFAWDDAKAKLKKDHRWEQVAEFDRGEMERLFGTHMGAYF